MSKRSTPHDPRTCARCAADAGLPVLCVVCRTQISEEDVVTCLPMVDRQGLPEIYCAHAGCNQQVLRCAVCDGAFGEDEGRLCRPVPDGPMRCVHPGCAPKDLAA